MPNGYGGFPGGTPGATIAELRDDLAKARARVAELEAALRPFSDLADRADAFRHGPGSTCLWRLAYDDLARARAAIIDTAISRGTSRVQRDGGE